MRSSIESRGWMGLLLLLLALLLAAFYIPAKQMLVESTGVEPASAAIFTIGALLLLCAASVILLRSRQ